MATKAGLLGFAALDGVNGVLFPYTVPAGKKASVTVSLCNGSSTAIKARAGYVTGTNGSPVAGQWLVGGAAGKNIPAGDTVQATTMLGAGQSIGGAAEAVGISLTINGIEEALA